MVFQRIARYISNLSVANKLLLIYLLDLSAVIFITTILIHEKFIAIDFARKEISGNQYISEVRKTFLDLIRDRDTKGKVLPARSSALSKILAADITDLIKAQRLYGARMQSTQLNGDLVLAVRRILHARSDTTETAEIDLNNTAIDAARRLISRVGDQSNLILDPDLDSYYTMSLVLLRFPDTAALVVHYTDLATRLLSPEASEDYNTRAKLLVMEGKLAAAIKSIDSDFKAAYRGNPSGALRLSLAADHAALMTSLQKLSTTLYLSAKTRNPAGHAEICQARRAALESLFLTWSHCSRELEQLLQARVASHFKRMWLHLGTAITFLVLILFLVYYIARKIVGPIRKLAQVALEVQNTSNYNLRAERLGNDEIGQLVTGFNTMLERLNRERLVQQELVAAARASEAQRQLFESIPLPLTITSLDGATLLHANLPALDLFAGGESPVSSYTWSPFDFIVDSGQREAFFATVSQAGGSDECELLLRLPAIPNHWTQVSARPVHYQGEDALLLLFTPLNHRKQLEEGLRNEKAFTQATVDCLPGVFFMLGSDFRLLSSNRDFEQLLGRDLQPDEVPSYEEYFSKDQRESVRFLVQQGFRHGSAEAEVAIPGNDGTDSFYFSSRLFLLGGEDCLITVGSDISARRDAEKKIELWARVFQSTSESILITDANLRVASVNQAFCTTMGYETHEIVGRKPLMLTSDLHDKYFLRQMWRDLRFRDSWQGEFWSRRKNGEVCPQWLVVNSVRDQGGTLTNYIALFTDISEQKSQEQQIQHIAHHDSLTGLPNRLLCMERLVMALQQANRSRRRVAVLFMDLDRFKNINDSLGHHVGDCVLVTAANRLSSCIREGDTVSRLGGDEFVVILANVEDSHDIASIMEHRLLPLMRQPYDAGGYELHCSCSIGISIYPEDGADKDTLLRNADSAMYQAKMTGRNNYHFYTEELNTRALKRLSLENNLRNAIERDELLLYYQPKLDLRSGRTSGFEALLRWKNPENGIVPPGDFIPIAEETGIIIPIGTWVVREACRQINRWSAEGLTDTSLSLNVSAVQFRDKDFVECLLTIVREEGVSPAQIELELTETMLMEDAVRTIRVMDTLKDHGFSFSIDDFGTGYSSLNYLHRFPIDCLKIDKSFVRGMLDRPAELAIIKAIIGLGHTLEMRVIAEGVENVDEFKALRAAGCDEVQGYFIARPMPPERLAQWCAHGETGD
ncbi:MAG: EAL domain-containing protein [Geobacteraceae bacterium]|nr:EAL domain-containing protein [Geobacteraceae bacterium]